MTLQTKTGIAGERRKSSLVDVVIRLKVIKGNCFLWTQKGHAKVSVLARGPSLPAACPRHRAVLYCVKYVLRA